MPEGLSGIIERVTFHNPETGYAVLRVFASGRRGQVTVVGHLPAVYAGEFLEGEGDWVQDRDHGLQFKAANLRITPPHTKEGIVKYLASGLVKGIGPHYARKIVDLFGDRTLDVIDESPTFLTEVKGIGAKRVERIRESWREQKAIRGIMVFLQSNGVGTARAVRIYKTYGDQAVGLVRENPYRLATDIWGVGFQTADELAGRLGISRESPLRARAAVRFVLHKLSRDGHVGFPETGVIERTTALTQISADTVSEAIEHERAAGEIVREPQAGFSPSPLAALSPSPLAAFPPSPLVGEGRGGGLPRALAGPATPHPNPPPQGGRGEEGLPPQGGRGQEGSPPQGTRGQGGPPPQEERGPIVDEPWLYAKPLFMSEVGVARGLKRLSGGGHPLPRIDTAAALQWVEKKMGVELAPAQRDAIRQATEQKVLVITGGPGVGKTTIVRGIVEIFAAKKLRVALCAPTGRAAKRLAESTGREAKTIHRLLEFEPGAGGFKRDADHPLDFDLIVVDEASMVDIVLMNQLLRAVSPWSCLVLVGDVDQLPSVGPGTVLADVIESRALPVVRLTEIFRQAGQSWIVRAAHAVNSGEMPSSAPATNVSSPRGGGGQGGGADFFVVEAETPEAILDRLVQLVRERIPARFGLDPLRDVQVLSPMNRSELGVRNLNAVLQNVLNPPKGQLEIQRFGWTFRVGDKVMQTENNYQREVFNGNLGRVADIDELERALIVDYDGRRVPYDFGELDELALCYACSIHKSQGGEYPAVVIPLHTQHYMMLQRNLLYTGITRGRKLVVLVGSRRAIARAVQQQDHARRYSLLSQRLKDETNR